MGPPDGHPGFLAKGNDTYTIGGPQGGSEDGSDEIFSI